MIPVKFTITTNGSGAYTSSSTSVAGQPTSGAYLLYAVEWIEGTLADDVDAVLSMTPPSQVAKTLLTLTNADNEAWYYPRVLECDNAGTALATHAPQVVTGTLGLAVTSGGDTKSGACIVYLVEV